MSESKKYKVFPKWIEEQTRNTISGEGLYIQLGEEGEKEIMQKLERGEYELLYIGTFAEDFGTWSNTWYQPIEEYTTHIPRYKCKEEYGGTMIEGLCFMLKYKIGVWKRELLIDRGDEPRLFKTLYKFVQFFEIVPSQS